MKRSVWLFILCAAVLMTLSAGIRQGLGLFLRPISLDLNLGRQVFGLALAIQTLVIGLSNPFAGILADRYGHWRVALAGATLLGGALVASRRWWWGWAGRRAGSWRGSLGAWVWRQASDPAVQLLLLGWIQQFSAARSAASAASAPATAQGPVSPTASEPSAAPASAPDPAAG